MKSRGQLKRERNSRQSFYRSSERRRVFGGNSEVLGGMAVFSFGKYKGKRVADVPKSYLHFLIGLQEPSQEVVDVLPDVEKHILEECRKN